MNVRYKCVESLRLVVEEKIFFNSIKSQFEVKDTAFANMLITNALRYFNGLNGVISSFLKKPLPASQSILKYVMVCAGTEILFMDTPEYAAINEYVSIAKKCTNKFAAGMVNAILRNIVRNKDKVLKDIYKNILPAAFEKILAQDYTKNIMLECVGQIHEIPKIDLSVKSSPELWAKELNGVLFANGTVRIDPRGANISSLKGFADGCWWVQDLAASLPVRFLGNVQGLKVLDLCAAPGGKTAQLLAGGAEVTAVDIDAERLQRLDENIRRLQLSEKLTTVVEDGLRFLESCSNEYDVIMLDAPCSATGIFRRHPEVLQIKSVADVKKQLKIQKELLNTAAEKLRPGGRLLYCTCSIAKAEGEKQIEDFLLCHGNFELLPLNERMLNLYNGIKFKEDLFDKGVLRTLPYYMKDSGGMDAFFAACMVRKK